MTILHIATQFSKFPGGRFRRFGNYSGEEFREDVLVPAIDRLGSNEELIIDISDVMNFPPSFLDEAFAAIIRDKTLTLEQFKAKIKFEADEANQPYIGMIDQYLKDAQKALSN